MERRGRGDSCAVDEIYATDVVSEATWKELGAQFDRKQLLDVLITAGYRMVSMALNTFGVLLEPDSEPLGRCPRLRHGGEHGPVEDPRTVVRPGTRSALGWFCWWHRWRGP